MQLNSLHQFAALSQPVLAFPAALYKFQCFSSSEDSSRSSDSSTSDSEDDEIVKQLAILWERSVTKKEANLIEQLTFDAEREVRSYCYR